VRLHHAILGAGLGALALATVVPSGHAGAAAADATGRTGPVVSHSLPSYVHDGVAAHLTPSSLPESQTITDTPGNVYVATTGVPVPEPAAGPADLISASASDNGTSVTFSAITKQLNNPATDPNWLNNTYIGWGIAPNPGMAPTYFAYFQLNPDGSYDGELTYAVTDTPVSCTVTLDFSPTLGYQAVVPTACLPGVTSFQWLAYSLYDTVPRSQDPTGAQGFGKALPDYRRNGGVTQAGPIAAPVPVPTAPINGIPQGYWLYARDGGVFAFGASQFYGSEGGTHLNQPIVGGDATLDGKGYWLVASDGGVFSFGDARYYGSMGAGHLNAPIVALITLPTGTGYWLVAADGGVFAFGDARFYGSAGGTHLNAPIVGGASSSDGRGYWLVASDGGVFAYGDAGFAGSEGGQPLNQPVVAMAADPEGGYWLVSSDGGIFAFGGAPFYGSTGSIKLNKPIEGMTPSAAGLGYRMDATDGGVFAFGGAMYYGSMGGQPLNAPVVAMASQG
jgi:hypothetical protein